MRRYALLTLTIAERRPLLADPRWARQVRAGVEACRAAAPGALWAYAVRPAALQLVVGPGTLNALEAWLEQVRTHTATALIAAIRQAAEADALDALLRFSPVWGGARYRVWQAGYHRVWLWDERRWRQAIAALESAG